MHICMYIYINIEHTLDRNIHTYMEYVYCTKYAFVTERKRLFNYFITCTLIGSIARDLFL